MGIVYPKKVCDCPVVWCWLVVDAVVVEGWPSKCEFSLNWDPGHNFHALQHNEKLKHTLCLQKRPMNICHRCSVQTLIDQPKIEILLKQNQPSFKMLECLHSLYVINLNSSRRRWQLAKYVVPKIVSLTGKGSLRIDSKIWDYTNLSFCSTVSC